jgi:hypothetical protein
MEYSIMAKLNSVLSLIGGKTGAAAMAEAVATEVRGAVAAVIKSNDLSRIVDTIDALSGLKGVKVDILRGMLSTLRADMSAHVVPMDGGNKRTAEQRAAAEKAADAAGLFKRAADFAADFAAAVKADAAARKAARDAEKATAAGNAPTASGSGTGNAPTASGTSEQADADELAAVKAELQRVTAERDAALSMLAAARDARTLKDVRKALAA